MVTIGIDQLLSNFAMYKHRCLVNIKKLYTYAGKCEYQLQFKAILEESMVFTLEIFIDNRSMSPETPMIVKSAVLENHSVYLPKFWMSKTIAVRRVGASKSEFKAIRAGIMFWSSITQSKLHTKINAEFKKYLYNGILQHTQVVQYPITNDLT